MSVLSIFNITPPARFDGTPWTVASIQEAPTQLGAWTTLEDIALVPDVDPADPAPRDLTTDLALLGNWYRVVFKDASANASSPTAPFKNTLSDSDITPSLREVSALLRARINEDSDEFTDTTNPTATQVKSFLGQAANDIRSRVPQIPDTQLAKARWLAALQAARLIELSYFPEQGNEDRSVYSSLTDLFNPAMAEFIVNCRTPMATTLA